jgi:hypothetical protein
MLVKVRTAYRDPHPCQPHRGDAGRLPEFGWGAREPTRARRKRPALFQELRDVQAIGKSRNLCGCGPRLPSLRALDGLGQAVPKSGSVPIKPFENSAWKTCRFRADRAFPGLKSHPYL